MLTKRTNILFDQKTWDILVGLAREKEYSVGELVRRAVKEKYLNEEQITLKQREEAIKQINSIRKQIKHKFTREEIRESIEYGRKY
ncbi:hypothetical protein KBD81_05945 [Candidatus Woesebacteria bacterium]|nr:hypothetical protein [Candidatus Woesebacteria bacterium]